MFFELPEKQKFSFVYHFLFCFCRHWLCYPSYRGTPKCILHHHFSVGYLLFVQLLYYRAPLGFLWPRMEYRYDLSRDYCSTNPPKGLIDTLKCPEQSHWCGQVSGNGPTTSCYSRRKETWSETALDLFGLGHCISI